MAGHIVTPYEIYATRARARNDKDKRLLLASLSEDTAIDLLEVVADNLLDVDPINASKGTHNVSCAHVERDGDVVWFVMASDHVGEREVIHDGEDDLRPAVFEKRKTHVNRYYALGGLHRAADAESGVLLVHSPWGRGGRRGHVVTLLQRAVAANQHARAKLSAGALVPEQALRRMLRNAESTSITYLRDSGVQSTFGQRSGKRSAPARMALRIRGQDSKPYRDALVAALRSTSNQREQFFTIDVRDDDGKYTKETFDDVEVDIQTAAGTRKYSMRHDTLPTMGFNLTPEINSAYWGLPEGEYDKWPSMLLAETRKALRGVLDDVIAP